LTPAKKKAIRKEKTPKTQEIKKIIMPTIHEEAGLVFNFYSSDMDEPPHVHVEYKEGGTMKI